jgi:ribosome-associated protein
MQSQRDFLARVVQQERHSRPGPLGWPQSGDILAAPSRRGSGRQDSLEALDLAKRVVDLAEDKQASDIVLLDIRPISPLADYFVICSGNSERQLNALTRDIAGTLKKEAQLTPLHSEGDPASGWVLLDYGDVVVHFFAPAERDYYRLEELWGAASPVVRIQ